MEQLCEKVTCKMIRSGLVEADKKEWMVYILQKKILKCIGVGLFLILQGLLVGWLNALAFYIVFANLHTYAGGWHAPKPWICFVISGAVAIAVGLIGPLVAQWPVWAHGLIAVLSLAVLAVKAPVATYSQPFTAAEYAARRRILRKWIVYTAAFFALSALLRLDSLPAYIAIAAACVAITIAATK